MNPTTQNLSERKSYITGNQYKDHEVLMRYGQWYLQCHKTNKQTFNTAYVNNRVCPDCGPLVKILPEPIEDPNLENKDLESKLKESIEKIQQNKNEHIAQAIPEVKVKTQVICNKCELAMEEVATGIYYCRNGHKRALVDLIEPTAPKLEKEKIKTKCPFCKKSVTIEQESQIANKRKIRYSCGHSEFQSLNIQLNDSRDAIWDKLYEFQREGVEFVEKAGGSALIGDEMGLGKANLNGTPVLTPCGWKNIETLQIGDTICTPDGKTAKIDGVYSQGIQQIVEVKFNDGTSSKCVLSHLWNVQTPNWKFRFGKDFFKTMTTEEIKESGLKITNGNLKYYIPITKSVELCEKSLPIDPYCLGYLLGNGCFSQHSINVACTETEIIEQFEKFYETTRILSGFSLTKVGVNKIIQELKLKDKKSNNKFIPEIYKFNSIENRLAILQGLMDSDGYISQNGDTIQYTTVSEQLKNDVKFLVQSLGGIAYESSKIPTYTYKGEKLNGQLAYTLTLNLPTEIIPFRLSKKVILCKPKTKYLPTRGITEIEYIGDFEATCIHIDNEDHLYITNDFIVTHNTVQALAFLRYNYSKAVPCLMVCESSKVYDWQNEFKKWVSDKFNEIRDEPIIHQKGSYGLCPGFNNHIISMSLLQKPKVLQSIMDYGFKLVIIDESHSFKDEKTSRTGALQNLARKIPNRIFLSGTPVMNKVMEYFVPLNLLKPEHHPSKSYLADRCMRSPSGRILGLREHYRPRFFHQISEYVIRRTKKDAGIKLPKFRKFTKLVAIDENKAFVVKYNAVADEIEKLLAEKSERAKTSNTIIGLLAHLRHIIGIAKIEPTIQMVEEFLESTDSDEKIAIGVHHKLVMEKLAEVLREHNPICISDEDPKIKMHRIEDFRRPENRVAILSILGAGQGLNLQFCKNAIIAEREWNPSKEDQFFGRFHRIAENTDGSIKEEFDDAKDSVTIDILNVKDTIDEFFDGLIDLKSKVVNSTMNEQVFYDEDTMMQLAEMVAASRLKYARA